MMADIGSDSQQARASKRVPSREKEHLHNQIEQDAIDAMEDEKYDRLLELARQELRQLLGLADDVPLPERDEKKAQDAAAEGMRRGYDHPDFSFFFPLTYFDTPID